MSAEKFLLPKIVATVADKSDKSSKVIADIYIDDKNLGGLPDWGTIYEMITKEPLKRHRRKSLWKKVFKKHRRRK